MRVLAISGSFKKISFNTMVLGYVAKVFAHEHEEVSIEFADISKLPLFCEDIENDENSEVKNFRDLVRGSDAIIICTPEHNYSVPAALKNALDWASRPFGSNVWENKPCALISCSIGSQGGSKAHVHLKQICDALALKVVLMRPDVVVPSAYTMFDSDGNITDINVVYSIKKLCAALVRETKECSGPAEPIIVPGMH